MYPAPCVSAGRKSRTNMVECCWLRTVALRPQVTRATVFICVTRRTSKYQTARTLFGHVSDSKRLQRWFTSVVWTCRRLHKTRWISLLNATIHAVSKRCVHIIGTSAVRSMMHSILVTKTTSEILTDVNKIRPWGIFTSDLCEVPPKSWTIIKSI